jgi:predicted amidophosphoribosyltransferase
MSRYYTFNRSIAMKTGALDQAIKAHKYEHKWGWGIIFARVLLGYLATTPEIAGTDLIIPMPSVPLPFGRTDRRGLDHTGWVIQSAQQQDDVGYSFRVDPPLLVKLQPTARMADSSGYGDRQRIARDIYDQLEVRDQQSIAGSRIAVFDDVFTTGSTLNSVARKLREAGAREVVGVTLSRAPWR